MTVHKTTAKSPKQSAPVRKKTTKSSKQSAPAQKKTAKSSKHTEGFLDTMMEGAKEVPGYVGHGVGQGVEKVTELAGVAAEKAGAFVAHAAHRVGLGKTKKSTSKRSRGK